MRLEILGGPLGVKFRIQGHLGVRKGEKPPFGQNCPKADATIKVFLCWKEKDKEKDLDNKIPLTTSP